MLIDSHAHLDAPYFKDVLPKVVDRAKEAGIKEIITVGVTPSSSRNCLEIARRYECVRATVGYHPHWAKGASKERLLEIEQLAHDPSVVALGEIGLDYYHFYSPKDSQINLFHNVLEIAVETGLPVVIHDRDAHEDVYRILSKFRSRLKGGIIHCFSGNMELAKKYLDWGFFLSIPGTVTYPKNHSLREIAKNIPLERLLLETDAPHLTPLPYRGRRKNEPAFLNYTALEVAKIRGITVEQLAKATTANVYKAFRISGQ